MNNKSLKVIAATATVAFGLGMGAVNATAANAACAVPAARDSFQSRLQRDAAMFFGAGALKTVYCSNKTVGSASLNLSYAHGKINGLSATETAADTWNRIKLYGSTTNKTYPGEWCAWTSWFLMRGMAKYPGSITVSTAKSKMLDKGGITVAKGREQAGDVIFYDGHMGVVITTGGGKVVVLEGNTATEAGYMKLRPNPYTSAYTAIRMPSY